MDKFVVWKHPADILKEATAYSMSMTVSKGSMNLFFLCNRHKQLIFQ